MEEIADGSVNLICSDPPYMGVKKSLAWDNQWKTPAAFLEWMGRLCVEWRRVLAPNGSLYVFASPRMAARVECVVGEHFEVLNQVVWSKSDMPTHALKYGDDRFRQFVQKSERIIFAEHFGADSMAMGESGYAAKCEQLRGFVFEPLRSYLDGERRKIGISSLPFDSILGTNGLAKKYFNVCQWQLPTEESYRKFQAAYPGYFRREYEDLRREYEDLRRPFSVSADVYYTDVWDFPTVAARTGKHPCEKPAPLISHIIAASSRPGDVVLDSFMGSGVTGESAIALGRRFIGIEMDETWFDRASRRINGDAPDRHARPAPARKPSRPIRDDARDSLPLFRDLAS
jgi:site-specific DNA-methyltransferase (adenine-specific)